MIPQLVAERKPGSIVDVNAPSISLSMLKAFRLERHQDGVV
jgi:hypothetical protein